MHSGYRPVHHGIEKTLPTAARTGKIQTDTGFEGQTTIRYLFIFPCLFRRCNLGISLLCRPEAPIKKEAKMFLQPRGDIEQDIKTSVPSGLQRLERKNTDAALLSPPVPQRLTSSRWDSFFFYSFCSRSLQILRERLPLVLLYTHLSSSQNMWMKVTKCICTTA